MAITIDGTNGITSPGGDSSAVDVTTPKVKNAGTLALEATGANVITFSNNSAESARIDFSGNLLVGTAAGGLGRITSSTSGFNTAGANNWKKGSFTASGSFGGGIALINTGGVSDGFAFYTTGNPSQLNVQFGANGGATSNGVFLTSTGTSWTAQSDERTKDIIEPITNAVEKVSFLRTVIGKFKTDEINTRRAFLIAQDVQVVLPEAVDVRDDELGTLGVRYTDTIPLLVAAIKEQQTLIQALTARIEALEVA